MQKQANKQKQRKLIYKPYAKGSWHGADAVKRGLKLIAYFLMFGLLNLLIGALLQFSSAFLRWLVNLVLVGGYGAVLYMVASQHGAGDVNLGEIVLNQEQTGKIVPKQDRDRCYHSLKGLFSVLIGVLPLLLVTIPYALMAQKQVYSLQPLPGWVGNFAEVEEISLPLSYYQVDASLHAADILRMVVRVLVFPFANIATAKNAAGMLLVDRLSPLLVCLPALGYPLGYLTGPRNRAMVHGDIQTADQKYQRRQKKALRARQQRAPKKNELI